MERSTSTAACSSPTAARQPLRNLVAPLDHVFGNVVENLRAIVRAGVCAQPDGAARRFHGVANIFAIAQRRLAQQLALAAVYRERVAGIRPRLLAADVLLDGAVDPGRRGGSAGSNPSSSSGASNLRCLCRARRQRVQPLRRQVFEHAFASAFAPIAGFAIAAEAAGGVELVGASSPTPRRP